MTEQLLTDLSIDYQNIKVLDDGTICGTGELLFTRALYIGLNQWGWESRFCYEDRELAVSELDKLQTGNDIPSGWIASRQG